MNILILAFFLIRRSFDSLPTPNSTAVYGFKQLSDDVREHVLDMILDAHSAFEALEFALDSNGAYPSQSYPLHMFHAVTSG